VKTQRKDSCKPKNKTHTWKEMKNTGKIKGSKRKKKENFIKKTTERINKEGEAEKQKQK
jgi:hypothetical protein